jgi:energy-coupling factor transporter ATP-binding protein EcfA2
MFSWNNESAKEPLSAIRVFDGRAAAIHLDEDLTYSYIPRELDSFDYVQDALEKIRKRLESGTIQIRQTATEFPNSLRPGSIAFRVVTAESVKDHAVYAESLCALTESEIGELRTLPQDIEALKSGSIAAELRLRAQRVRLLSAIASELENLSAFDAVQYSLVVTELEHAVALESSVSSEAFERTNIPKLLEPAWRAFIAAGESYIKDGVGEEYPREEQECIYCRQPLRAAAVDLVRKYRDFSNSTAQEAVSRARRRVAELAAPLWNLADAPFGEARAQLELSEDALLLRSVELYEHLRSSRESVTPGEELHAGGGISQTATMAAALRKEVGRVQVMIKQLSEQESSRLETVGGKELRLAELSDRISLAGLIGNLRTYDADLELLARAESELGNCRSYQRALTLTAKDVSERLLNESFESRFRDGCEALSAPEIKLAFPGRMGKVIRQKGVGEGHKLSTILSEGEQKVIALADFLAELSLRPEKVTVVFDDPVTSLDCRRIREVSRRIARLASQTQVVILTHNIVFVAELMDAVDAKNFAYYDVRRAAQPGFISVGTNPRIDTFNKLRIRINSAIGDAKKLANAEEQRKQVELIYDHIRSACEVLVEQELLKKLSERYLPNLKMTVLAKIKYDRLEPAARIILEIFEKACRYIPGHSQPLETLGVVPTLAEVEQDWKKLQQAKDEYDR